jgi:hypothetical protein
MTDGARKTAELLVEDVAGVGYGGKREREREHQVALPMPPWGATRKKPRAKLAIPSPKFIRA